MSLNARPDNRPGGLLRNGVPGELQREAVEVFVIVACTCAALFPPVPVTSYDGWVEFDLTSFAVDLLDGRVSAAGPATGVFGSPGFGPDSGAPFFHTVEVGETLFFSVLDNSGKGIPDAFIEGKVPSFLPPGLVLGGRFQARL